MNRYSNMTIWQLQEEVAAIKSELATRRVEEEDEYHICGGEIRVWMRSQCGLCGDGPIRNPRKREPNAAALARITESHSAGSGEPALAAPVAEMVQRLRDSIAAIKRATLANIDNHISIADEAAALLAKLGQGDPVPWTPWQKVQRSLISSPARIQPMRGYEVVFREREDGAIFELLLPPLPPAPGASDE